MQEPGVADALMVEMAQGDRLGQVGTAELAPRISVVPLAPGKWGLAPSAAHVFAVMPAAMRWCSENSRLSRPRWSTAGGRAPTTVGCTGR